METLTCLLPMITAGSHEFMRLYTHYKNNILPFAGGLYDQPAAWRDAMEIIEATQARVMRERNEHGGTKN